LGTRDKHEIALQNYGFSRSVASDLVKHHRDTIRFNESNEVISLDKRKLLSNLKPYSLTYNEVNAI
ncbi:hypothetical protein, partial [Vibrio parahaemolyticus]